MKCLHLIQDLGKHKTNSEIIIVYACKLCSTIIRKNFCCSNTNFFLLVILYREYMARIDMDENIVTRKFLAQKICELMQII